jgi:hypothetical protein
VIAVAGTIVSVRQARKEETVQGKQNYENFEYSRSRHPFADALSAGFMMKSLLLRKLTPASNSGEFFPTERIRSRLAIIIK